MTRTTHSARGIAARWIASVAAIGLLAACGKDSAGEAAPSGAATVEAVAGSDIPKVTLTDEAAKRIDLQTAQVTQGADGSEMPYGAVLYDPSGKTWAFVNPAGLSFVREAITVDHIDGVTAFLTDGPQVGTKVVTVGATQLYGAELGVGDDE